MARILRLIWLCVVADVPEWERELQAELQEYEVVNDGEDLDDPALEEELLQQIEAEANDDKSA